MACLRFDIKLHVAKCLLLHGRVHGIKLKSSLRPQTPHFPTRKLKRQAARASQPAKSKCSSSLELCQPSRQQPFHWLIAHLAPSPHVSPQQMQLRL